MPCSARKARTSAAASRTISNVDAGRRIEVDAQLVGRPRVGGPVRPGWRPRHALVGRPQHVGEVGDHDCPRLGAVDGGTVVVCSQSGAVSGIRFWKNDWPADAVRAALEQRRAVAHGAHERLADGEVVLARSSLVSPRSGNITLFGLVIATVRPSATSSTGSPCSVGTRHPWRRYPDAAWRAPWPSLLALPQMTRADGAECRRRGSGLAVEADLGGWNNDVSSDRSARRHVRPPTTPKRPTTPKCRRHRGADRSGRPFPVRPSSRRSSRSSPGTFATYPELGAHIHGRSASGFIISPDGIAVTNNHDRTGAATSRCSVGGESTGASTRRRARCRATTSP